MPVQTETVKTQVTHSEWFRALSKYEKPCTVKAGWQLVNTFVPYIALWILMVWMLRHETPYWLLIPPIAIAAGFLMRIFIFFHDCGHGSFFPSRRANRILGTLCGVLTFTPFDDWRQNHAIHHTTVADLSRRGIGDIGTWTVAEYLNASPRQRFAYRFSRHPVTLFLLAPPIVFLITQRFPHKEATKRERNNLLLTNLLLLGVLVAAHLTIGLRAYLMIQIPIVLVTGACGVWLFYVQHQFEKGYWAQHHDWDPIRAALEGSSYYKLPKILQWFSGNIGLHHIHHLRSRIPNYHLQKCFEETPELQNIEPLTLVGSLKSLSLHLWDESAQAMVTYRALRHYQSQNSPS